MLPNIDDEPSSSNISSTIDQEEQPRHNPSTPQQTDAISESPPPYDGEAAAVSESFTTEPPPLYTDVVKLPTYNESENLDDTTDDTEEHNPTNRSMLWFWFNNGTDSNRDVEQEKIGTHVHFLFSFLMSFIFNWIGFLISYCFSTNLSSYYGAVTGFGLSLVKWGFLMKHHFQNQTLEESPWLFYIFVLFGWVVFLRGLIAYVQLSRIAQTGSSEHPRGYFM